MMMNEELLWLWLLNLQGIGRKSIKRLIDVLKTPEAIYNASDKVIESFEFLKKKQKERLKDKNIDRIKVLKDKLYKKNIQFIHLNDPLYPTKLKNIPDKPFGLYVKTYDIKNASMFDRPCVSIIGSRNCTDYGYNTAYDIAARLAACDITIISGMAKGIDAAAQKGALSQKGKTCSVLGCGVDICYPPDNIELYMNIYENGMLLSEYVPGTEPLKGLFPERNRIISGLSEIVIVVEAGNKSGSLITADMALEQGRDVYAVPGRLTDAMSEGCNKLIRHGAGIFTDIKDVLFELGMAEDDKICILIPDNKPLAIEEKIVYARLSLEPKHIESIIDETGMPFSQVMSILVGLEMKKLVRQSAVNQYVLDVGYYNT